MFYAECTMKKWSIFIRELYASNRHTMMMSCVALLSISSLLLPPLTSCALAGGIEDLEGITGQHIDRPGNGSGHTGSGGDTEYHDPFSAPIVTVPVGFGLGLFMGGHWFFKKISGDYPNTNCLDDYAEHQKIKDENGFSAGATVGGLPWLLIYGISSPIYHGIAAISDAISSPSTPSPKSNSEIASDYYDKGKIYESAGNWALATTNYRSALQYNPNLDGAYSKLAYALLRQKKYSEAIEAYKQAIAQNNRDASAYKNIADIYSHNLGQKTDAEQWYRKALGVYAKDDPSYPVVVGELINAVNDINKNDFNKRVAKQESLLSSGQYAMAAQAATKALIVNSNSATAWYIHGEASEKLGNVLEAERDYRKAVELDPSQKNRNNLTNLTGSAKYSLAVEQAKALVALRQGQTGLSIEDTRYLAGRCFDDKRGCTFAIDNSATPVVIEPRPSVRQIIDKAPPQAQNDPKFVKLIEEKKRLDEELAKQSEETKKLMTVKNGSTPEASRAIDVLIVNSQIEQSKKEYEAASKDKEINDKYINMGFALPQDQAPSKGE